MKKWLKIIIVCEILILFFIGIGYFNYEKEWIEKNSEDDCRVYNVSIEINFNISENNYTNQIIYKIPK